MKTKELFCWESIPLSAHLCLFIHSSVLALVHVLRMAHKAFRALRWHVCPWVCEKEEGQYWALEKQSVGIPVGAASCYE